MTNRRDSETNRAPLRRIWDRWSRILAPVRSREALKERQHDRVNLRNVMLRALVGEVNKWSAITYDELREQITEVIAYEGDFGGVWFQAEVQMLEDEEEYVHVAVSVDDGNRWACKPFTHDFLVYADGRVDK